MALPPLPNIVSFTKTWHNESYPFISPTRPELSAAGKNVVVTGGGAGIGKAAAIAFAEAGARSVAIVSRRADRLQAAARDIAVAGPSTQVLFETGDVTDLESIKTALKNIAKEVGKFDVFVSNAGILPAEAPVANYDKSQLELSIATNVMGPFNSLQAFLPLASPGAKVFNIGSSIEHWQPQPEVPGMASYAAAKLAAYKIFDYFAFENPDLHVVTLHPGIIATEINPRITVAPDTVELPAHTLVWLASEEAAFLKGRFVWANWDAQELLASAENIRSSLLLKITLNGVEM